MTQQTRNEIDKAIERAHKYGLFIAVRGTRKSDGARVWGVTSHSREAWKLHQVVRIGQRLECDCAARVYCSHKALVHEELAAGIAAAQAAANAERNAHITERLATLERQPVQARSVEPREWESVAERRDTSPLAPRPAFSMWA